MSLLLRLNLARLIHLPASATTLIPTIALSLRMGVNESNRDYDPEMKQLVLITIVPFAKTVINFLTTADPSIPENKTILTLLGELLVQAIGPICSIEIDQNYLTPENQILIQKLRDYFHKFQTRRTFDPKNFTLEPTTKHFGLVRWTSPPLLKDLNSLCSDINTAVNAASSSIGLLKLYERVSRAVPEKMYPADSLAYDDPILSSIHMQLPLALLSADGMLHHFEELQNAAWRCHPFYSDELLPPPQCAAEVRLEEKIRGIIKTVDPLFSTALDEDNSEGVRSKVLESRFNWLLEDGSQHSRKTAIDSSPNLVSQSFPEFAHEAQSEGSVTAPDAISSISLFPEVEGEDSSRQESH